MIKVLLRWQQHPHPTASIKEQSHKSNDLLPPASRGQREGREQQSRLLGEGL